MKNLLLVTFIVILFTCCKKEPDPYLETSLTSMVFQNSGGEQQLTVSTNLQWELKLPSDNWVTVSQKSGVQDGVIRIKADENKTVTARTTTLTITVKSLTKTVTLMQDGAPATINLDKATENVGFQSGSISVQITTNGATWNVGELPGWITTEAVSGQSTGNVRINYQSNILAVPRTATINFTVGTDKKSLTITQARNEDVFNDREALIAVFNEAKARPEVLTNWLSDQPLNQWKWVGTDNITGRVTSLLLPHTGIAGTLSDKVYNLTELKSLGIEASVYDGFSYKLSSGIKNLKNLETLVAGEIKGDIPEEIYELTKLKKLLLYSSTISKLPSPEKISVFKDLTSLTLYEIDCGLSFPSEISSLRKLNYLAINKTSGQFAPTEFPQQIYEVASLDTLIIEFGYKFQINNKLGKLKELKWLQSYHPYGEIPDELYSLTDLRVLRLGCSFWKAELSGNISPNIGKLTSLNNFEVINCNLTGQLPKEMGALPLAYLKCYGNRLFGQVPQEILTHKNWFSWAPSQYILPQQEGYGLTTEIEKSTDFSQDGKFYKILSATKGKGIDLVFLGEGFIDKEVGDGKIYDQLVSKAKDLIFNSEPLKSYKEYFNVYCVRTISPEKGITSGNVKINSKFSISYDPNQYPAIDVESICNYVGQIGLDNRFITVIVNTPIGFGVTGMWKDKDFEHTRAVSLVDINSINPNILVHESIGHGFGLLYDEYYRASVDDPLPTIPNNIMEGIKNIQQNYGIFCNIDFTDDLTKIRWANLAKHPKYSAFVGAFEGATYRYGVWRPEFVSIMGPNGSILNFNTPSREIIVKRIKLLAGEPYSFDDFVAHDKIDYTPINKAAYIPNNTRKHFPPILIGK